MHRRIASTFTEFSRRRIVPGAQTTAYQPFRLDAVSHYSSIGSKATPPLPPSIRIEIADNVKHYDQCYNILVNLFAKNEPLAKYLGTPEKYADIIKDVLDLSVDQPCNVVAFDGDKMIGLCTGYFVDYKPPVPENIERSYAPNFDLTESIKNAGYKYDCANTIAAVLGETEREMERFLPGCKRVMKPMIIVVDPEYKAYRIGPRIIELGMEISRRLHCDYAVGFFTALASTKIYGRRGYEFVKTLPLEKFHANGHPIFGKDTLPDGNDAIRLGIYDLRKEKHCKH